ncbi:type III-A CRISPR-associated protein Cas10/Csm1 [Chlorobaculum thiosulfatiphilum]|uniref:CRISPR system single-strand-specific deoxyribonuclease Cas10/Csm1 (subtype III-A) n=1 Tax=Chlorobaculum thiosulfatiphilum TaxID=115852 RepID=A0A5C4S9S7_CHLTI|nr:type III-A CRISPR-associated protein Cas10/Csm1 [Chlorobaculum thiosulfatiphilum]TNJ40313.1 type III-A CRISPR-associated protein Cas10/Csm1 [Chlorobaculum thiosulfatiphilum]
MPERNSFYLGALLHDVGKFVERGKLRFWSTSARWYVEKKQTSGKSHAHKRYSAAFIKLFRDKEFLSDPKIEELALHHHPSFETGFVDSNSKNIHYKLLQIADIWASKEREKVTFLERVYYTRARLQSIFSDIRLTEKAGDDYKPGLEYHELTPLSTLPESLFPAGQSPRLPPQPYHSIVEEFKTSFGKIRTDREDELLPLLWKYFNAVPAQTPYRKQAEFLDRPDINLFDHSRVTAAIALCLYDEWMLGEWNGKDKTILKYHPGSEKQDALPAPCILVGGSISGIQKFIFNVPSKMAAKTLKARSFYVQFFADLCAQKVLDALDLKQANLLYNGGGRFYILAPKSKEGQLDQCRNEIMQNLLRREFIDDELSISLACVDVAPGDFMEHFGEKWGEVNRKLDVAKMQKFRGLDYDDVFEPKEQRRATEEPAKGDLYTEITESLKKEGYRISDASESGTSKRDGWRSLFRSMGYEVDFTSGGATGNTTVFNTTDFEGKYSGFRFAVKDLPRWRPETISRFRKEVEERGRSIEEYQDDDGEGGKLEIKTDNIITYSQLAFKSFYETGTEKLGILKMDVDDLGKIFAEGFPKDLRTPSRVMSLSRSLQWFFEGYMNTILRDEEFRDYIYPIFSGGDDLFMVGAWHKVFDIALKIREEFQKFVCNNPSLTLSASLLVVDEHYPVSRFAVLAEERLHEAKYGRTNKNSINVFGEILNWQEFRDAEKIKEKLVRMVKELDEPKAIIQKVLQGCRGLETLSGGTPGKQQSYAIKVWQMAYFFRDLEREHSKAVADEIIAEYEKVVFDAMKGETVNPMYIAVGARWAEMASREKNEKNNALIIERSQSDAK